MNTKNNAVEVRLILRMLKEFDVLTKQQYKTLEGQVLAGDVDGAKKGLKRIIRRLKNDSKIEAIRGALAEVTEGSAEKQVEEMENDLRECHTEFSVSDDSMDLYTDYKITAQNMICKGWRKQSKGEWKASDIPDEKYVCSVCGGACWYYDYQGDVAKSRYCPNCGAKMKRGAE